MQLTQQNLFDDLDTLDNKGTRIPIEPVPTGFRLHYEHPNGKLYQGDAIDWLNSLNDETIDLIFADPPYNIRKAQWDRFESQESYFEWSMQWIAQAAPSAETGGLNVCLRLLRNTGGHQALGDEVLPILPLDHLALPKQGESRKRLGTVPRKLGPLS